MTPAQQRLILALMVVSAINLLLQLTQLFQPASACPPPPPAPEVRWNPPAMERPPNSQGVGGIF